jgi:16S rRNA (guanine527-N7)-methyltransferase
VTEAPVSRETRLRIEVLAGLIRAWNPRINLVSPGDLPKLEERHLIDCLQLAALIPPGETPLVDLGSGGGLPGLVLASVVSRPVHLVEADRRKAAFLSTAAAELALPHVTVHPSRIEAVALREAAGVVTARALAPLPRLLDYAAALLGEGGVAIFPKGRQADAELTAAAQSWTFDVERFPSRTDPHASILRVARLRPSGR